VILIVEGTDGVGKTAFCRWYAAQTGATYLHAGPPQEDDPFVEYVDSLEHGRSYVLDRWHVGEIIWPTLFDRPSIFTTRESFIGVNDALHARGAQLLVVYREEDDVRLELTKRGEDKRMIAASLMAQRGFIEAITLIGTSTSLPTSLVHSDVLHAMVVGENIDMLGGGC
jgi:hypothetical protein